LQVIQYNSQSEQKASQAERLQRTLKLRLARWQHVNISDKWVEPLKDLVGAYNRSRNSVTKETPFAIMTDPAVDFRVFRRLFDNPKKRPNVHLTLKKGSKVRLSMLTGRFAKESGHRGLWTSEVFKIAKVLKGDPDMYKVADLDGRPLKGSFYMEEVQLVRVKPQGESDVEIEKILKRRTVKGERQAFVKWKGRPKKFNSWTPLSSIR